ncbi:nucleotide disphospho-sugar-binding domain-containing protein [Streptomyces rubradiris]|uniref:Glycosyl transferase n=1 Tax=Streptomyces rubradiris TaxID=285531 RepID=A0ABQ3RHX1_STRRR|nr:nucleotide disphospho-sugar-binding domain-containing protein [Streptomyces rubradiris]GHH29044.1 glycosyl transferase [Streptomyces rubradiris]GHI55460.1 glycosyl transferase [Streptomyces rubradiris]
MRVLFCAFPATAHVHPLVPLAWALQNAGHEVRVAIHPGAAHLVTEAGLAPVPVGAALTEVMEWNDNFEKLDTLTDFLSVDEAPGDGWVRKWAGMTRMLAGFTPMLDDLVGFCRTWQPDLVLWDPFCVPAAVAATVTGAAQARFLWGQDNIGWLHARSRERLAQRDAGPEEDPVTALMQPMLEPYGLAYCEELLLGQWSIDPVPAPLRLPVDLSYEPIRRVPYNGNRTPPAWVHERPARPRVCLSLGMGGRGRQLFREAGISFADMVAGLAELDIELVTTLHAEQLATVREVPENVRLVEYVPLNYLLPNCSALIHHGGGGTFAAAVTHRVPQLVTPLPMWGEARTARYVADSGAGLMLEPREITVEVLREQVRRLVAEPSFQAGADQLHTQMRSMPGPDEVVRRLEALTAQHRGQRRAVTL